MTEDSAILMSTIKEVITLLQVEDEVVGIAAIESTTGAEERAKGPTKVGQLLRKERRRNEVKSLVNS
jgi:hypothetical protein